MGPPTGYALFLQQLQHKYKVSSGPNDASPEADKSSLKKEKNTDFPPTRNLKDQKA